MAEKSAGAALLAFPAEYRVSGVMTVLLTSSGAVDEKEIIASLNRMYGPAMPMDEVFAQKESLYLAALTQLQAVPELVEHSARATVAFRSRVISGSTGESATASLQALDLGLPLRPDGLPAMTSKASRIPSHPLIAAARLSVEPQQVSS